LFIHLHNLPFVQMPAPTSIGQRFIQLIQHLGLSKNAFAQSLDKTATVIQHLVEERNKPGYDLLCKVFEVYPNVSKDWLMEGAGSMMKQEAQSGESFSPAAALSAPANLVAPTPVAAAPLIAATEPAAIASAPTPVPVVAAPAVAVVPPVALPNPMPAPVEAPVAVAPPAPVVAPAPDPAYLTAALQTQYLQHQLALAEQRNQHLLEQQALMQQLVAVLQRASL
jgi:plasmid maintenance system antidote protein VapI